MSEATLTLVNDTKQLSMTHKEIADLVDSRPDNVKVSIERLAERGVIQLPATKVLEEISNLGLPIKRECYVFEGEQGRRDSIVVVAQLCPEFTAQIVDRWQELEKEKEQAQTVPTPQPVQSTPAIQINDGIAQLARVVADATASATMKALVEVVSPLVQQKEPPALFKMVGNVLSAPELTQQQIEGEYVPVSKAAWKTGLSDSICRKMIGFFNIPVRSIGGARGLQVSLPDMERAAQRLLSEATPPKGNRKRWSHPQFGNFTYYADLI
ncbi:Rha family transcriptional regulator [Salmonella enterica]|nr:Rha family transcriptional regulator [Salmonella enterica]EME4111758.1 Rha family transcriptional regulator [Salmonella enterica]EME6653871.1 Rha family transcriptional regulator [Salmonella enterica]